MDWYSIKASITDLVGLSRDALHILSGLGLQLVLVLLLRSWTGAFLPWLLVLIAAVGNEWFDLAYETWPDRGEQWSETVKDLVSTMLLPTVLILLSRFAPGLFRNRRLADRTEEVEPGPMETFR